MNVKQNVWCTMESFMILLKRRKNKYLYFHSESVQYILASHLLDSFTFCWILFLHLCYIYISPGQAASVGGTETLWPAAGLQFIDWVSVDDIWVLPLLFSAQSTSLTEEINEAQLCKIGVKYVQLWLHIYQKVLFDFPLDSIHYQNGLQKLVIKNKLMLINSDCCGH